MLHSRLRSTKNLRLASFSSAHQTKTRNQTTPPTSSLSDLLLAASLFKAFSSPIPNPPLLSSPLPESVVLHLLRHPSLPPSSKLSFFHYAFSSPPSTSPPPSAFAALLRSLSPPFLDHVLPILPLALSSGLDPAAFRSLVASLIRSSRFDSAVAALDAAAAEAKSHPGLLAPATYSSVIRAFLEKSQLGLALSTFWKLLDSSPGLPDSAACRKLLVALRKADMKDEFKWVFDELSQRSFAFDTRGYNVCIHAFGSWGQLGLALGLFREMKMKDPPVPPDVCTYNSVVRALCLGGKVSDALAAFEEMKGSGHEPDRFTYHALIQGCCKTYQVDEAIRVFQEMEYNNVRADTVVYNTLLNGLLKVRKLTEACQLFEKMASEGVRASCYSYNILIDGLFKNGRPAAAFVLFCELKKKGQFVDGITYSIVVMQLCRVGRIVEGLELVKEMEERGLVVDLVTITALLIGLHKSGRQDLLEQLIKHVRDSSLLPNVLRWKANMEAAMRGPQDKGKDYTSMFPSVGSLNNIMSSINPTPSKDTDEDSLDDEPNDEWSSSPYLDRLSKRSESFDDARMFTVHRGQRVQATGVNTFDIDMVNTYLSIFLAKGKLTLACKLFEIFTSLGRNATSYTYNSLMSTFVKKGYMREAWAVLQDMGDKLSPGDIATYNVIIQGLGKMGKANLASLVLDQLLKKGGYLDIVMYNTLFNALGKAGRIDEANQLFQQMIGSGINPDVITYNTLIEVHAKAGRVKEAYKFLRRMLAAGCSPNHVTDTILDFLEKEIEKLRYKRASIIRDDEDLDKDPPL
ncbi:pentatricopeptide repeat-containing protein At4g01570 [Typha angustifolia]|uniref:pentatricopeptide repeat-containing protein At4g01570 n=1 Tax=Typha angustifolia TaxID=59011 RepID=UPI003C2BA6E8